MRVYIQMKLGRSIFVYFVNAKKGAIMKLLNKVIEGNRVEAHYTKKDMRPFLYDATLQRDLAIFETTDKRDSFIDKYKLIIT